MASNMHARGAENLEVGNRDAVMLGLAAPAALPATPYTPPDAWDKGLDRLRRTAEFSWLVHDDHKWIHFGGHNHLSTFPTYRRGMFTLRSYSSPSSRAQTIMEAMAKGKTHACLEFRDQKLTAEANELPLYLFWVDLALAMRFVHIAEERVNQYDQNRFWLFDWQKDEVKLFARRIEL